MQETIGLSKGGLTTKIHVTCDAGVKPTGFHLTPGQAHDLEGASALLPRIDAHTVIADKAFDADERVIEPLQKAGENIIIPPKSHWKNERQYDEDLYKARHRIENFSPNSSSIAPSPPDTMNAHKTSLALSISPPQSYGSTDDTP